MRAGLVAALLLALVAGCRGSNGEHTTEVRVYFLRDGKVWPVAREVSSKDAWYWTMQELFKGPTAEERNALGAKTEIPGDVGAYSFDQSPGVADFSTQRDYPRAALAQVVYTAMQFPGIKAVDFNRKRYTRADFENQTPLILVESPLPFAAAKTPLRVTGTANTFEATFDYELRDSAGKVLDSNFVTATSGTGTRGTFDFTTKKADDAAKLVVFERSAADGSRIHEAEIPLRTSR